MKTILIVALFCGTVAAQEMTSCPMHQEMKSDHRADVERHGDEAMGFSRQDDPPLSIVAGWWSD